MGAACTSAVRHDDVAGGHSCLEHDYDAKGAPSEFTLAGQRLHPNVSVASPRICHKQHGWAYIAVSSSEGLREFAVGRAGCLSVPTQVNDAEDCPVVAGSTVLSVVHRRLQADGIRVGPIGRGPCGSSGPYANWDFSITVYDWRHVDQAVRYTADAVRELRMKGVVGVAVRGEDCALPEPSQ